MFVFEVLFFDTVSTVDAPVLIFISSNCCANEEHFLFCSFLEHIDNNDVVKK
jgi:hypothetical protein